MQISLMQFPFSAAIPHLSTLHCPAITSRRMCVEVGIMSLHDPLQYIYGTLPQVHKGTIMLAPCFTASIVYALQHLFACLT